MKKILALLGIIVFIFCCVAFSSNKDTINISTPHKKEKFSSKQKDALNNLFQSGAEKQ